MIWNEIMLKILNKIVFTLDILCLILSNISLVFYIFSYEIVYVGFACIGAILAIIFGKLELKILKRLSDLQRRSL